MSTTEYDLLIVGGGPAGAAAAITARRHDLRVLVIEAAATPGAGHCPAWVGPAASECCKALGVDAAAVGVPFTGVTLRSWDLKDFVDVPGDELGGLVVEPAALSDALIAAAEQAGVEIRRPAEVANLELSDRAASARLSDGTTVMARVVIAADGAGSTIAMIAGVNSSRPAAPVTVPLVICGGVCGDPGVDVILGSGSPLKQAVVTRTKTETRVALHAPVASSPDKSEIADLVRRLQEAKLLPAGPGLRACAIPALAGMALELDTHVGKHLLVIGDAGGFVSAFSHEGLYPALRSGVLAAEAAAAGFDSPVLQDALSSFSSTWRAELADYLRMPSTDLGLLMPMVFKNPQMSARVARAFLLGQAF